MKKINEICPPEDPLDTEYCDDCFLEINEFKELKKYVIEIENVKYEEFDFNISTRSFKLCTISVAN